MEPVLTQEELEAIYEAMQGEPASSASVDDFALTAGHEFVSRAEAVWAEKAKAMVPSIESTVTGALGSRTKVESIGAEALDAEISDNYQSPVEESGEQSPSLDTETSVITVVRFGQTQLLFGVDSALARKYVERRTGASADEETSNAAGADLTPLEQRLLNDLVKDLIQAAVNVAPDPCTASIDPAAPEEVWQERSTKEMWMMIRFSVAQYPGSGLWLRGPVSTFLPKMDKARQTLAERLSSTTIVLSAELGKFRISVGDLWRLKPGSLVPIEAAVGDPMKIFVGDVPKLQGVPLVSRGNIAIRITGRAQTING